MESVHRNSSLIDLKFFPDNLLFYVRTATASGTRIITKRRRHRTLVALLTLHIRAMRTDHSDHKGWQSCLQTVYTTRDSSRFFPIQDSAPYKTIGGSCVHINTSIFKAPRACQSCVNDNECSLPSHIPQAITRRASFFYTTL